MSTYDYRGPRRSVCAPGTEPDHAFYMELIREDQQRPFTPEDVSLNAREQLLHGNFAKLRAIEQFAALNHFVEA